VRSFPRLRRLPVDIVWDEMDDLLLYSVESGRHVVRVNRILRSATDRVLKGGIAHELSHIDADMRMGRYQLELAWQRYERSRWSRVREEQSTERRVLALGYGPQLLAFVRYARRLGYSFSREHGLPYAEIRRAVEGR
jgi:hypothetical protein